ncbi:hypothetical protein ACO0LO_01730 [Undibacterium sp. TJN25]|uniref:hypothetical protein n=1 Tax=Undibacterium sp. TJN25 TaxID=3413056 RepID=UPI003BF3F56F
MTNGIPGFWDVGPPDPLPVEATWRDFVRSIEGSVIEDLVPPPRDFQNADFLFPKDAVVAELKEIHTEFSQSTSFKKGLHLLMTRLVKEKPEWRPALLGGDGTYPDWFPREFARIFRPALGRILKKANSQIKETKEKFNITSPTGVLLLVNEEFTSIDPTLICALVCDILANSYSSISAMVYVTVNRYVKIPGSNEPKLLWVPCYAPNAGNELVNFINTLGAKWGDFLEEKIGPFTSRIVTGDSTMLLNSKAIVHPELPVLKR